MSNRGVDCDVLGIRQLMEEVIHDRLVDLIAEKRDEIEDDLAQELDSMTLSILSNYNIETRQDTLVITVNKGGLNNAKT